ncbi:GAF domain-containing protein [Streptomyces sp. SCA3-4]|uniref:helix-turn-helix domain-containing protein n=1 Tax=Streptomyces sichuanensis TaxID=2871810 RepID=UPI001CE2F386|nr:GAF domain-containing protein [Streptomyces sichuanensis]MCA6092048.1 GAF domain-containing protein [Streptomyces sichuanensis]
MPDDHRENARPGSPASDSALSAYLELLATGAPADAYERPLLQVRADGAPPDRVAAVERARLLALRVRAELEDRKRREAELSALFATAQDLAGLRDIDAVLQAIVRRARSLLGTDAAYLTLNDEAAGDTYMRVTDGSVSARFQELRLGMGEGLGGLVAQTARPYVTDHYMEDPRFQHTPHIDSGVRDEGLVAILGVPLRLGSAVIGVLFAADRRSRVFDRQQIALLASFAAHAAVAIETANLLAETRSAVAELEAANAIVRDHSAAVERAADIHDRLTELVLRGGGVHDVAAAVAEVLGGHVEFLDAGAYTDVDPAESADVDPTESADVDSTESADPAESLDPGHDPASAVERSRAEGRAVRHRDGWIAAVSAGDELLGALRLHDRCDLGPVDRRALERAAMVTSLLQLARRSAGEAEQRVRGELLDDLLDAPDRAPRLLRTRAARLRADLDTPHLVLAARIADEATDAPSDRQRLWSAAAHLAATGHGLAAARDGGAVLLVPHGPYDSATATARNTARRLGEAVHARVTVGASAPVAAPAAHPGDVATAYAEARRCLDVLHALGRGGEGAAAEDFGFLGLLLTGTDGGAHVREFITRTIGPVVDYDTRRGTALVNTLDAYFTCGMSPVRTKDALHVHVNTVAQRLDRVGHLLGADWQSPARTLEIQLALRLHGLSPALGRH